MAGHRKTAAPKPTTRKVVTRKTAAAGQPVSPRGAPSRTFDVSLGSERHALFFEVPLNVKEVYGHGRAPVQVTITPADPDHPSCGVPYQFRTTVAVYAGRWYVPVRKEHRDGARVKVGDRLHVVMTLDTAPRIVSVPPELAAALRKDRDAATAWKRLSYSHQKEHAMAIAGAKRPETRLRRLEAALAMLTMKS